MKHRQEETVLDQPEVQVENVEQAVVETPVVQPEPEVPAFNLEEEFKKLQAELAELKTKPVAKNHKAGIPKATKYVRLGALKTFGKVPQQQADIAAILTAKMPVGQEFTEAEVFAFVTEEAGNYPQLRNSKQHPTYLFRYYRGLKNDAPHAGFIAREFLRAV